MVLDSSAGHDVLLRVGAWRQVADLIEARAPVAAPDLFVFELLAAMRRHVLRGVLSPSRASAAVGDLGDLSIELIPTLPLREAAWRLRDNMTAGDALFAALAQLLEVPLVTKDRRLAVAARKHASIEVIELGEPPNAG